MIMETSRKMTMKEQVAFDLGYKKGISDSEDKWISVDDRLPDEKGEYLVTYHPCYWDVVRDNLEVGLDSFRGGKSWAKNKYHHVIAWKKKPQPYKEVEK